MRKKIIFFHPYFGNGGVEKTNIRLSRYFIKNNYEVEFLSLFFKGSIVEEAKQAGIKLTEIAKKKTWQSVGSIRRYITHQKKDTKLYVISCQNYANIVMWFSLIGKRHGLKLIFAERNHPSSLEIYSTGVKDKIILWLMKHLYKFADKIIANSQELAEDLSKIVCSPVDYIYNPVLTDDFMVLAQDYVSDEWFHQNIPIVLSVGRFERQKDFATLIQAFSIVREQKQCRMVLIGEGSQEKQLRDLVVELHLENEVHILGFDPNPYKYMAYATVFVVSSLYEGLCNSLIEATALKVPCVATNCKSGTKEILLNGKGGKLVNVGDICGLANTILWVLNHLKEAEQLMLQAHAHLDRFMPETVGQKYLNIIENGNQI